jgi:tetratricopeptide (TPR) repeat protein
MKKIFIIIFSFIIFLSPFSVLAVSKSDAYTYFAMGYYYLYNNELKMSKIQFKLCLAAEDNPPPALYTILAEICDMLGELDEAELYVTKALSLDPDNETALQFKALILVEKKEYEEAITYLKKLNSLQPFELKYLYYLSDVYGTMGDDDNLIETYTEILKINPELMDVHLNLGYLYTKKGLLGKAKNAYQDVLNIDSENEKALFYLTYISLSEGNSEEALLHFRKLDDKELLNDEMLQDYAANLFIENQNPEPVLNRIKNKESVNDVTKAIQYFFDDDIDKAKEHFENEVRNHPDNIVSYVGLIRIAEKNKNRDMEKKWRFVLAGSYYKLYQFEKSLEEAIRVKEMDTSFLENRYLLGDIYTNLNSIENAIVEYEYFKNHSTDKADIYIKLGLNYDEIGKHKEAAENFKQATALYPEDHELYYYLGIEYRILEEYENAASAFLRATQIKDDNAYYYFNLGVSYERLGKIDEAIFYLDKSIQIDGANAMALNYLGYLLADKGIRLFEAKELIEKALKIDPDNGAYLDSIGWVHYRLSDYGKAKEYLEQAIQFMDITEDENYLIYEHLGDTYSSLGLYNDAIEAWEKALEMRFVEEIQFKIENLKKELPKYN